MNRALIEYILWLNAIVASLLNRTARNHFMLTRCIFFNVEIGVIVRYISAISLASK